MKKGFTMIELIFVIVILGILASVAIPRLAGTREDAEIATTIGNLRTLLSDASGYYVAKGTFDGANWKDFTNAPLVGDAGSGATLGTAIGAGVAAVGTSATAHLAVGGANCIGLHLVDKTTTAPAHIKFTKDTTNGVCGQVIGKDPVKSFIESTVTVSGGGNNITEAMAIGSNISVYSK